MRFNRLYTPSPAAALAYLRRPAAERCRRCAWDAAQVLAVEVPASQVQRQLGVDADELAQIQALASPDHADAGATHLWTPPCQADAAETIAWLEACLAHDRAELRRVRQDIDRLHARLRDAEAARIAAHNRATNADAAIGLLADPDPDRVIPSGVLEPRPRTPKEIAERLARFRLVAKELMNGLDGQPFSWRLVDAQHSLWMVRLMGLTLASKTHIERLGWRLKQGVQPVGSRYFSRVGARDVYLLEAQAVPVNPAPPEDRNERRHARRIVRTGGPRRRTGAPSRLAGAWAEAARIYRDRAINLAVSLGMTLRDARTWQEACDAERDQRPLAGEELAAYAQDLRERNETLWMHSVDLEQELVLTRERLAKAEQALRTARAPQEGADHGQR